MCAVISGGAIKVHRKLHTSVTTQLMGVDSRAQTLGFAGLKNCSGLINIKSAFITEDSPIPPHGKLSWATS